MSKEIVRNAIAARVAKELRPGSLVNLGIGMPTLVAKHVDDSQGILFQSENGMIGVSADLPDKDHLDNDITNAGGQPVCAVPEVSFFDSALSFAIIRGGHVDASVLGALEVDQYGNLANWIIPGKAVPGMGGAMDLVMGARTVIVAMEHCDKRGNPKVLSKCTLPLTASYVVNLIVTEKAVIRVTQDGLILEEVAKGLSVEEVQACTDAPLAVTDNLKHF